MRKEFYFGLIIFGYNMININYIFGLTTGIYFGVKYNSNLKPYVDIVENEVNKKIEDFKKIYE